MTDEATPTGRSVLVTGGNRGIGRAIAERFIAAGDRVAVTSRNGQAPEGALAVPCEMTDTDSVNAAFETAEQAHGPVQVLVANAGITRDTLLMRMSDEDFEQVIDTNLTGVFRCTRRAARSMMPRKFGRIILISSVTGLYGAPGQVNYAASKAALVGIARSITREMGARGITANVVAPGFIETDMTAELPEERRVQYAATIPSRRFGTPDDVAAAVEFLAGPGAGYISGAVIPVDAGLGMGH